METYTQIMEKAGDEILSIFDPEDRFGGFTKGWPLTDFSAAITIALVYVFITIIATAFMKAGIPALDPYPIKFIYNVSQIFACAYFSVEAFMIAYRNSYSFACNTYDKENPAVANLMWLFYVSKIWDFWDTAFIVLGKKWKQLSFLHVYHHFSVLLICWLQLNVLYDGDSYLFIMLNAFIHTVMYSYYFVCMHTKNPETGKILPIWWKSSLTMMQMVQFVTLMGNGAYAYLNECESYNHKVSFFCVWYTSSLLLLFGIFFVGSYGKKSKRKEL